ncbi:MAG: DUF2779 domain-containing protein [Nanoarchaeota archaeon]
MGFVGIVNSRNDTMTIIISKSKYLQGLQCPLLVWTVFNDPNSMPEVDADTQAVFDRGQDVGSWAKKLFPDGVEVEFEKGFKHTLEKTRELVKTRKTIFEASFSFKNTYSRADILLPIGKDAWDILEVKSSTSVKDINVEDVAFQQYCYKGAGLKIRNCILVTLNKEYVRKGEIDPKKLFTMNDITANVQSILPTVEGKIKKIVEAIAGQKPTFTIGPHCSDPYECPLCEKCWAYLPEHNVTELYHANKQGFELLKQGIIKIADIPASVKLGRKQQIQKEAIVTGKTHTEPAGIKTFFKTLKYPRLYLDFETFQDAIPRFDGLKPYQQVPFQYSLHIDDGKKVLHKEFLAEDGDPRKAFVEALSKDLPVQGSIIAYNSSFEMGRLKELAEAFPKHAAWINKAIARIVDLLVPFRDFSHYNPEQHGSCSIKAVLPALCGTSYEGLEISNGGEASAEYVRVTYTNVKPEEREKVRKSLLIYCKQDTQAMIDVLNSLEDN